MRFSLSTRWNASRHTAGEAMLAEIRELGFDTVELGYDLRLDLAEGVRSEVARGNVRVSSVHNFCPVPVGAPRGHPELFQLTDLNPHRRTSAVHHTSRTVEFAAEVGATCVVAHAGNVDMRHYTRKLIDRALEGHLFDAKYERIKDKLLVRRDKKVAPHLEALARSIDELLPVLERSRVRLCLENLPSWEAIPTETEMMTLFERLQSPWLGYWHDFGHAQVRQNLGLIRHRHWMEKLQPWLAGTHIHDVKPPAMDHLMPPDGEIDFAQYRDLVKPEHQLVFEPMPGTPPERVQQGLATVQAAWRAEERSAPRVPPRVYSAILSEKMNLSGR